MASIYDVRGTLLTDFPASLKVLHQGCRVISFLWKALRLLLEQETRCFCRYGHCVFRGFKYLTSDSKGVLEATLEVAGRGPEVH
jgi:hypothetical protein